jgi:hypothetical protein
VTTPATISTTLAADKVLGLVKLAEWTCIEAGTAQMRTWLDMGTIQIPSGTAGAASVRGAFYLIENGDAAPSSAAANSYGHSNMSIIRNASYATSWPLGSAIIDEGFTLTAGDWELWGAVVVNSVGDLNGVSVTGTTPSGIVEILSGDGSVRVSTFAGSL